MSFSKYPKYNGNFAPDESSYGKKQKVEKAIERLKEEDNQVSPVVIEGKTIVKTWWGKAWIRNLESYADYRNRISRGKNYVKNGAVLDLKIHEGKIEGKVQGSGFTPYSVKIDIDKILEEKKAKLLLKSTGEIENIEDLLLGNFPKSFQDTLKSREYGLFPEPNEIHITCTCPDKAVMCKHVAAVMCGVGARLDSDAGMFFSLRGIEMGEFISESLMKSTEDMLKRSEKTGRPILDDSEVFDLFGIEME